MIRTLYPTRNQLPLAVTVLLFGILMFLMRSSFASDIDLLNLAITIDLVLTVPFIYFLLVRRTAIPLSTTMPVMIAGLLLGTYFLPKDGQAYLTAFKKWGLPVIEITVLTYVILKVRNAVRKYHNTKAGTPDFFPMLKTICREIFPGKLAVLFATEVAVLYYGFFSWKTRSLQENEFTYHKNSGSQTVFAAIILIAITETFTLHLLITRWHPVVAWILTGLSIYTAIQILGIARSLSKRPISIQKDSLALRYGMLMEVEISFSDIEKIEQSGQALAKDRLTKTLSPLGSLESHNVIIHLKNELEAIGFYGIKTKFKTIAFFVDEPVPFNTQLTHAMLYLTGRKTG